MPLSAQRKPTRRPAAQTGPKRLNTSEQSLARSSDWLVAVMAVISLNPSEALDAQLTEQAQRLRLS
jgi:hypothetical protein